MADLIFEQATKLVGVMEETVEKMIVGSLPQEIAEIVKFHSKAAAAAAGGAAWIPGAGGIAAAAICGGFVWTMYSRIGSKIGLPFGSNVMKSLASGVVTNLASGAAGAVAISTALSLIPGLGSVEAGIIMGGVSYALTLASGYLYLKIMTNLFSKGVDPATLDEKDLHKMVEDSVHDTDVKKVFNWAKRQFKREKPQSDEGAAAQET